MRNSDRTLTLATGKNRYGETAHSSASSSIWEGLSRPGTRIAASFSACAFCSSSASLSATYSSALSSSPAENSLSEMRKSRKVSLNRSTSPEASNSKLTKVLIWLLRTVQTDKQLLTFCGWRYIHQAYLCTCANAFCKRLAMCCRRNTPLVMSGCVTTAGSQSGAWT